jgi:hypothetical protein
MVTRIAMMTLLLLSGATATAADAPPPEHREVSKEAREKMAQLHEQMAACLRTDKTLQECHSEMMKNCQEQLGSTGCPPLVGHGLDGRHRMQPMGTTPK